MFDFHTLLSIFLIICCLSGETKTKIVLNLMSKSTSFSCYEMIRKPQFTLVRMNHALCLLLTSGV